MALTQRLSGANYDTLFKVLGEYLQRSNRYVGLYTGFDTDQSEIEAELNTESLLRLYEGIPNTIKGYKTNVFSWVKDMNSKFGKILTDKVLVLDKLSLGGNSSAQDTLLELIVDMNLASESCAASVITVGSITSELANAAPGTLLIDTTLDGVTPPHSSYPSSPEYLGLTSQLALTNDNLRVSCVNDTYNGTSAYNESFQIVGSGSGDPFSYESFGSGNGPTILPIHSKTLLSGLQFTSFTANVPASWTISSGAAGTEILEETTTVYEGTSSLELVGTGTDAVLYQTAASVVTPLKRYIVACYLQTTTTLSGASTVLEVKFAGTGYSPGAGEKISMDLTALNAQTSWGLEYFYVNMPAEIPSDFKLEISLANAISGVVHFDFMAFAEVTYWNGVNWSIVSGTDPYVIGDEFRVNISNNDAGVFQSHFRKAYGIQVPTNGSPTILDSWAT